jgi:hypothetical protein
MNQLIILATLIVCDPETIASPTGRVSLILSSDREANINKAILSLATLVSCFSKKMIIFSKFQGFFS